MAATLEAGEKLFAAGKIDEAVIQFEEILRSDPNNISALNNLGVAYFHMGKIGPAASCFSRVLQLDPYHLDAVINYARLLKSIGSVKKGLSILEVASKKYPDNPDVLALIKEIEQRPESQEATAIRPSSGQPAPSPRNNEIHELLSAGRDLYLQGSHSEAEDRFMKLVKIDPGNFEAYFHLGQIALNRGSKGFALDNFFHALIIDPVNARIAEAIHDIVHISELAEIQKSPRMVLAFLINKIAIDAARDDDFVQLDKHMGQLEVYHLKALTKFIVCRPSRDYAEQVVELLKKIPVIDDDLATSLGLWMDKSGITRSNRDEVEFQICLKNENEKIVREIARRVNPHNNDEFVVPGFETYPRRLTRDTPENNLFMKEVPEGAPDKKTGLKVLVISDYNIAGQHTRLMRSLNKYTNHMARCVIFQDDFLSYDHDVVIRSKEGVIFEEAMSEAAALIKQADFFHIGRQLNPITGIKWDRYISPRNAVFQYHGSLLRNNGRQIAEFHEKHGFEAITCVDWSIYKKLQTSFYHMHPCMIDTDRLPAKNLDFHNTIRLVHAPSGENYRKNKRSDIIIEVMKRIAGEDPLVQFDVIENVSNSECLERKSNCHVHIVSLLMALGLNAVESAAMGVIPVTTLDNFSRFIYHDTPFVHATKDTAYEVVKGLLSDRPRMADLSVQCREWTRTKFDAKNVVRQYAHLYDLIYHGLSVDYPVA